MRFTGGTTARVNQVVIIIKIKPQTKPTIPYFYNEYGSEFFDRRQLAAQYNSCAFGNMPKNEKWPKRVKMASNQKVA